MAGGCRLPVPLQQIQPGWSSISARVSEIGSPISPKDSISLFAGAFSTVVISNHVVVINPRPYLILCLQTTTPICNYNHIKAAGHNLHAHGLTPPNARLSPEAETCTCPTW